MDCSSHSQTIDQIQSADSLFEFIEGPNHEERKALDLFFSNYPLLPDPIQDYKIYFSKVVKHLNPNSIEEFEKAFIAACFEEACHLNPAQSSDLTSKLKSCSLSFSDCRRIALLVQKILFIRTSFDEPESVYLWRRTETSIHFPIPRQIQIQPNGTLYLTFNRVKSGDRLVGKGSYKVIKTALNLLTGQFVARIGMSDTPEARSEFNLAKLINHKFFIKTLNEELVEYNHKIYFHQELFESSLKTRMKSGKLLSLQDKFVVATALIEGLLWLHEEKRMIHRDIKAANLLVSSRADGSLSHCVITDLSFVGRFEEESVKNRNCGSCLYTAPEYFASIYSPEAVKPSLDCWSAGIVLYQLFRNEVSEWSKESQNPPWFIYSRFLDMIRYFKEELKNWVLPAPQNIDSVGHLVIGLLQQNPDTRFDMKRAQAELNRLKAAYNLN